MSSIVVAPLGAEQVQHEAGEPRKGLPAELFGVHWRALRCRTPNSRPSTELAPVLLGRPGQVLGRAVPGSGAGTSRSRGWRAVRPRTAAVVAREGRRVAAASRDAGMATAEYAIATLAAVGFAGLLVVLLKSDLVRGLLTAIIRKALQG